MLSKGDQSHCGMRMWELLGNYWKVINSLQSVVTAMENIALLLFLKFWMYVTENKKTNKSKQKPVRYNPAFLAISDSYSRNKSEDPS